MLRTLPEAPASGARAGVRANTLGCAADAVHTLPRAIDRVLVPLILTALSTFTHLWRLRAPPGVVFDEHHFGRFTNQYHAGTYLFDIHPPLGKLVFYAVSSWLGYDHRVCDYTHIGNLYSDSCQFMILRYTAAAFGIATAPALYFVARNFGVSTRAAILVVLFFLVDGLNTMESRLILVDSQLIFWCTAALLAAQMWWARWNLQADHIAVRRDPFDTRFSIMERVAYAIVVGVTCVNCVSIKFTGLATPGLIGLESLLAMFFLKRSIPLFDLLVVLLTGFLTFATYYWIHFSLLPFSGDGDGFMPWEFQQSLLNSTNYDPTVEPPSFPYMLYELNREMLNANARIEQRHHWDSYWWEWPLNMRGVLYYSKPDTNAKSVLVYLLGNPTVLWQVAAFMLSSLLYIIVRGRQLMSRPRTQRAKLSPNMDLTPILFCLIAYVLNLAPYILVRRSCFTYHYMPALMYGHVCVGLMIDRLFRNSHLRLLVLTLCATIACVGFYAYAPWIYALPLTHDGHAMRRWLPRWD